MASYPDNFIGDHIPLSQYDLLDEAARLQVRLALIHAFSEVESSGSGFLPTGEPKILFESHQFHNLTGGRYDEEAPDISTPTWVRNYGAAGVHQYARLRQAMALDTAAALGACSWGRFQQMGYQWATFGFSSIDDFVAWMCHSEGNHLHVFGEYCRKNGMLPHMRSNPPDYATCARMYNGAGYKANAYDVKLATADARYSAAGEDYIPYAPPIAPPVTPSPPSPVPMPKPPKPPKPTKPPKPPIDPDKAADDRAQAISAVMAIQAVLQLYGSYEGKVDGDWGKQSEDALSALLDSLDVECVP